MPRQLVPCNNPKACGVVAGHEPGTVCKSPAPKRQGASPSGGGSAALTKVPSAASAPSRGSQGIFRRFQSDAYNSQLGVLNLARERDAWATDAPYQRGLVWGEDRKRKLIESALMGIPISAIIVNSRPITANMQDNDKLDYVVDGKQRLSALFGYLDDEFAVPAQWFAEEDVEDTEDVDGVEMVRYSGLADRGQRMVSAISVPILRTNLEGEEAERELFDRLNFGGVLQGESDFA